MKMYFVLAVSVMVFSEQSSAFSWGAKLADKEIRKKQFVVEKTGAKKGDAYIKAVTWLAKTFKMKGAEILVKDNKKFNIIGKAVYPCKDANVGNGYSPKQRIEFSYTVSLKDNRARLLFEDVIGKADGGYDNGLKPGNKKDMEKISNGCLATLVNNFVKDLKSKKDDNW